MGPGISPIEGQGRSSPPVNAAANAIRAAATPLQISNNHYVRDDGMVWGHMVASLLSLPFIPFALLAGCPPARGPYQWLPVDADSDVVPVDGLNDGSSIDNIADLSVAYETGGEEDMWPVADAEGKPPNDTNGLEFSASSEVVAGDLESIEPELSDIVINKGHWVPTSTDNAPEGRYLHTAVWTGKDMIVWGGIAATNPPYLDTGGKYNPESDSWVVTSLDNAPFGRFGWHTAIWTGTEMIIWGGWDARGSVTIGTNTGGSYNPEIDTWEATPVAEAPSRRSAQSAVWTGTEMIIWGGLDYDPATQGYTLFTDGGRYNPKTKAWSPIAMLNAPSARIEQTTVWTGTEMIVWGGCSDENCTSALNTGARYDPLTDTWSPMGTVDAPTPRYTILGVPAIWTGSKMVIWGGCKLPCSSPPYDDLLLNTGGRYDPALDAWSDTATVNAPSIRTAHTAIWTGSAMLIWGGFGVIDPGKADSVNTGGSYNPAGNQWTGPTETWNAPQARKFHTAVWTGSEMIIWGGAAGILTNTGGRYMP